MTTSDFGTKRTCRPGPVEENLVRDFRGIYRGIYNDQAMGSERGVMDSAMHCHDQAAECRRLMQLAPTKAEAQALKNLARSWVGLAGQIDRYNALVREQRRVVQK